MPLPMKINYTCSALSNPTMVAMLGWVEQCYEYLTDNDGVFDSMEGLGKQLEYWRRTHQPDDVRYREAVEIRLFGEETLLISDKIKGEYIQLTRTENVQLTRNNG